ncbi:hypothetical protein [Desulfurivibrio alkaliphilus]|uniref:Uncharacterized protein n=1 Tax=Desulfurivibrio alkaliphilus (strain DSM 19089 / UNIQEM U267 / AHT2) TaxID=589865 RepID=D6Z5I9_DESAT|nr:hypothetical protein [Desulfurivibrio alkaliphilus]ADH86726.1 hypothetical protein DaAHT2_2052 [Desulfurivibrio alkaliphilus AHT 2]
MISLRDLAARRPQSVSGGTPTAPIMPTDELQPPTNGAPPAAMAENCMQPDDIPAAQGLGSGHGPGLLAAHRRLGRLFLPPSVNEQAAFRAGFAWLRPRLPQLQAGGWTRPELFRRNRARRGLAWLSLWAAPGVLPALAESGAVVFTLHRALGRKTTQTAWPAARCPGVKPSGGSPK